MDSTWWMLKQEKKFEHSEQTENRWKEDDKNKSNIHGSQKLELTIKRS